MLRILLLLQCLQPSLADTTVRLPTVTVTATRLRTQLLEAPARVTVLEAESMREAAAQNVADLLARRSGVFIRRYGGGGLASMSLRGGAASQTLVLLDGNRIASPQLGQLDLSLLPTVLFQSVEVMHGAGSALYGTDAMGGVVNLRTIRPGKRLLTIKGGAGAYGQRAGSALASGQLGSVSGVVAIEANAARADWPYLNKSLFPPQEIRRTGADRRRLSLYSAFALEAWQMTAWYNYAERGLPTIGSILPREERQWDRHLRVHAGGTLGRLRLSGLAQSGSLRYVNPQLGLDDTGRTFIASLDADIRLRLGDIFDLVTGLSQGYARARHPRLQSNASEQYAAAFASATIRAGNLHLYPALRADAYHRPGEPLLLQFNPRLGLNLRLLSRPALHLKSSAGRFFRNPTFNDRFWQPGGRGDLRPEQGWSTDLGLRLEHRGGRLEASAFLSRVTDQIQWLPSEGGYWAPVNLGRVVSRGLEASYEWRLEMAHLSGGFFYTLTDARDWSDQTAPSYVRLLPRHQGKSHLTLRLGLARLSASARYVGRRFITTDGSSSLVPFTLFDGSLELNQRVGRVVLTVSATAENVLNLRYEIMPSYPMPPRLVRMELSITIQ